MLTTLHVLRILSLAFWVGSIVFFAFGVAPVAFHVLPTTHEAGLVVGASLRVLHTLAFACGGVFLLLSVGALLAGSLTRPSATSLLLVLLMLALTAFSSFRVLPRMDRDQAAVGGHLESVPLGTRERVDFDRLHQTSERVEGGVLLSGLLALILSSAYPLKRTRDAHAHR